MELFLRRGLHMAAKVSALDGRVLHQPLLHLVVQLGVGDLRVLGSHSCALLHNAPEQHKADQDKDPEHDRLDGRIHQDSSFPAGRSRLNFKHRLQHPFRRPDSP